MFTYHLQQFGRIKQQQKRAVDSVLDQQRAEMRETIKSVQKVDSKSSSAEMQELIARQQADEAARQAARDDKLAKRRRQKQQ